MAAEHSTCRAYHAKPSLLSVSHRGMAEALIVAKEPAGSLPFRLALYRLLSLALGFVLHCFHERRPKPTAQRPERRLGRPSARAWACEQGGHGRWNLLRHLLAAPRPAQQREFRPWLRGERVSVGSARNP